LLSELATFIASKTPAVFLSVMVAHVAASTASTNMNNISNCSSHSKKYRPGNAGNHAARIPKMLQAVFLASNRGHDVHKPPPENVASKDFFRTWRGKSNKQTGKSTPARPHMVSAKSLPSSSREAQRVVVKKKKVSLNILGLHDY